MKNKKINFKSNLIFFILTPLTILVGVSSYLRFMVNYDYVVGYESSCDPYKEQCFKGCEDDACSVEYFYSKVEKYAADLYKECGKDVTNCEKANICFLEDKYCLVTYCDLEMGEDCEAITEDPEKIDGSLLKDININIQNI